MGKSNHISFLKLAQLHRLPQVQPDSRHCFLLRVAQQGHGVMHSCRCLHFCIAVLRLCEVYAKIHVSWLVDLLCLIGAHLPCPQCRVASIYPSVILTCVGLNAAAPGNLAQPQSCRGHQLIA